MTLRVAITGASGNVGLALCRALGREAGTEIAGIARRRPDFDLEGVTWHQGDVARDELEPLFAGADCVVHLAWLLQPAHDRDLLWRVNVLGTRRVLEAAAAAGVRAIVHASSVGAYAPGPKEPPVDESWPATGVRSAFYARHKAEAERLLDRFEADRPDVRVVRLRPGLIFQRASASEQRRLFAGPLLPGALVRPSLIPVVPDIPGLRFQCVHSDDVAAAYARAVTGDARGAFNIAADPVVDMGTFAELLSARRVRLGRRAARALLSATYHLHLQPSEPGWLDMALGTPLMDTTRARTVLGWEPQHDAVSTLRELLEGVRDGADAPTPPLAANTAGLSV